jgi:hypothetical protein
MDYFVAAVLTSAALRFAVSGAMNTFSLILLRKRLFDLESMVIWKWSEAPWWTRLDSDFQTACANFVRSRECQRFERSANVSQSGVTLTENDATPPGGGSQ